MDVGNNKKSTLGGYTGKGFMPGKSGNPSGRPKMDPELKATLRAITPEVVKFWVETMRDTTEDIKDRLRASENLIDRALGKAPQSVSLEDEEGNSIVPQILVSFVSPDAKKD